MNLLEVKSNEMSDEASVFIKKHIEKHMGEGMKRDQAVALAYEEARKKGVDISKKSSFNKKASEPTPTEIPFGELTQVKDLGIVITGAGKPLTGWSEGIAEMLKEEGIVDSTVGSVFQTVARVTGNLKKNGRTDLALIFSTDAKPNVGKLAMWRIRFGDATWIEDFVANYGQDYGYTAPKEELEEESSLKTKADRENPILEKLIDRYLLGEKFTILKTLDDFNRKGDIIEARMLEDRYDWNGYIRGNSSNPKVGSDLWSVNWFIDHLRNKSITSGDQDLNNRIVTLAERAEEYEENSESYPEEEESSEEDFIPRTTSTEMGEEANKQKVDEFDSSAYGRPGLSTKRMIQQIEQDMKDKSTQYKTDAKDFIKYLKEEKTESSLKTRATEEAKSIDPTEPERQWLPVDKKFETKVKDFKITRGMMSKICPSCKRSMDEKGIKALSLTASELDQLLVESKLTREDFLKLEADNLSESNSIAVSPSNVDKYNDERDAGPNKVFQLGYPTTQTVESTSEVESVEETDLVNTIEELEALAREMGFEDANDFLKETGVSFQEIKGKPFQLIHNRVYTASLSKHSGIEPFSEGEKVLHDKYGVGVVTDAQGGITSVQFGKEKGLVSFDASRAKKELNRVEASIQAGVNPFANDPLYNKILSEGHLGEYADYLATKGFNSEKILDVTREKGLQGQEAINYIHRAISTPSGEKRFKSFVDYGSLKTKAAEPVEERVPSKNPDFQMEETVDIFGQAKIALVEKEEKLKDLLMNFKAATELALGLPSLRKQIKEEEPRYKRLLAKLDGMRHKIGTWIIRLDYPQVKAAPKYKEAFEVLHEKLARMSPDLEKLAVDVLNEYNFLAEKAAAERLTDVIVVEREKEEKPKTKSSSFSVEGNWVTNFMHWVRKILAPEIRSLESQFDEIDELIDKVTR